MSETGGNFNGNRYQGFRLDALVVDRLIAG